ncbi:MAG: hypothetical protein BGP04_08215 [Rhizobiales bacterium 62-17]|nr:hypothetical protein [Hyphomicrobiales bacterium]OJY05375.1 MAG: hypothetical protein BGP04_08215 [Rhizobiales bacterium 62-17]
MQAAIVILFLAAPILAGLSLSLEGFVAFLLLAALVAGLSTSQDEDGEASEEKGRAGAFGDRAPPAYTIEVKSQRMSVPVGTAISSQFAAHKPIFHAPGKSA